MTCYICEREIIGDVVWLGEVYPSGEEAFPFCDACAEGPWPLYEIRREHIVREAGEEG